MRPAEEEDAILHPWWRATWAAAGLPPPDEGVYRDLRARHAEPHRAHHTAQHLLECRQRLVEAGHPCAEPGAVQLALWFHDAVYDTRRHDNEARSAELAASVLERAGAPRALRDRVVAHVLATAHRVEPETDDARLLVDIDLSILGAEPDRFAEYEDQVRREYGWVPDPDFAAGRTAVLRRCLARPHVYGTAAFRARFEARARENLAGAVRRWGGFVGAVPP